MSTTIKISKLLENALQKAQYSKKLPKFSIENIIVEKPRNKSFGNWSCNIAMVLAKELKKKPIDIAKIIHQNIEKNEEIETIEIVNPGFINFTLSESFTYFSAFSLAILHLYNLKYCNCEDDECCTHNK